MEKEKASAERMKVEEEKKHLKSILFIHNITHGLTWRRLVRYAWREALASVPGGVRGPSFFSSPSNVGGDMVPKTTPIQKILL